MVPDKYYPDLDIQKLKNHVHRWASMHPCIERIYLYLYDIDSEDDTYEYVIVFVAPEFNSNEYVDKDMLDIYYNWVSGGIYNIRKDIEKFYKEQNRAEEDEWMLYSVTTLEANDIDYYLNLNGESSFINLESELILFNRTEGTPAISCSQELSDLRTTDFICTDVFEKEKIAFMCELGPEIEAFLQRLEEEVDSLYHTSIEKADTDDLFNAAIKLFNRSASKYKTLLYAYISDIETYGITSRRRRKIIATILQKAIRNKLLPNDKQKVTSLGQGPLHTQYNKLKDENFKII